MILRKSTIPVSFQNIKLPFWGSSSELILYKPTPLMTENRRKHATVTSINIRPTTEHAVDYMILSCFKKKGAITIDPHFSWPTVVTMSRMTYCMLLHNIEKVYPAIDLQAGHILRAWMVGQMSHHCPDLSHHWNVSHHRYYVVVLVWINEIKGFYIFFVKQNRLNL